jgi:hypothetical protein
MDLTAFYASSVMPRIALVWRLFSVLMSTTFEDARLLALYPVFVLGL